MIWLMRGLSLEMLRAQIFALTEMMDRLIQGNSAREFTTANPREPRYQYESPFSGAPGTSRFPTVAPLTTAGYSPDTRRKRKQVNDLQTNIRKHIV